MDYMTIKQAADQWGISVRRIQILCTEGRIPGAEKFGRAWAIPADQKKPKDGRVTTGEYRNWRKFFVSSKEKEQNAANYYMSAKSVS